MYPDMENKIAVPIAKEMEIITRIQVCLIWGQTLFLRKIVERKAIIAKPKHQNHVSKRGKTCL